MAIRDLRPRGGVTDAAAVARTVNAAARLRAARLVAAGDRHLREAAGDPARLREAVGAYRRAATIASDQPDTFVRQALALVALGDRDAADAALARAVAIDGRLSDMVPRDGIGPADPVFERPAGGPPPLAARGHQILRRIAVQSPPDDPSVSPSVALVAARWAERFGPAAVQVARR